MAGSRFQRATALVPLALLSTAATASLLGVGGAASADQSPVSGLPDGSTVPIEAIEAPASLSRPGVVAPDSRVDMQRAVASASASGIPASALSAYQRAETVINAADRPCRLSWHLIAAIGRVESDHGRVGGNSLDDQGLARPGIYGTALDGSNNTAVIRDTDAGQYDDDARWDRAVGPMQFIPSTWAVVGVDGDNDGTRNPQDVDDAALASAVYLCSGRDDLGTDAGRRAAVFRYNHSRDYVDLVLSFMDAYLDGDFTSVPNGTSSSGYLMAAPDPVAPAPGGPSRGAGGPADVGGGSDGGGDDAGGDTGGDDGGGVPAEPPDAGGGDGGGGGGGVDVPKPPALPDPPKPVEDTLTRAEALAQCIADGVIDNPLTPNVNELTECVADLLG